MVGEDATQKWGKDDIDNRGSGDKRGDVKVVSILQTLLQERVCL
jgi:hypothetical protein